MRLFPAELRPLDPLPWLNIWLAGSELAVLWLDKNGAVRGEECNDLTWRTEACLEVTTTSLLRNWYCSESTSAGGG